MPKVDDELDTQVDQSNEVDESNESEQQVDDSDESHSSDESSSTSDTANQYFLDVDERHRYKTADDAKKAVTEASNRISQLSVYEKELQEYGNPSPAEIRGYLDELLEAREALTEAQRQLGEFRSRGNTQNDESSTTRSNSNATSRTDETKEEREARAWLQKEFPNLGAMPKDEALKLFKELQGKLGEFDQFRADQEERNRQSLVSAGRSQVSGFLTRDGFKDDEQNSLRWAVETMIADWINADRTGGRVAKWKAGGDTATALVQEGYEIAKKVFGLIKGPSSTASSQNSQNSTNYRQNKAEALKRNGKKLPTEGLPAKNASGASKKDKIKRLANGEPDYIGSVHDQAWEAFNSRVNKNAE